MDNGSVISDKNINYATYGKLHRNESIDDNNPIVEPLCAYF